MLTIRKATLEDLEGITEIYNDAILNSIATFDTETENYEEQRIWFANHGSKNPMLVAEEEGYVIGWASLSNWSDRWHIRILQKYRSIFTKNIREKELEEGLFKPLSKRGMGRFTYGNCANSRR